MFKRNQFSFVVSLFAVVMSLCVVGPVAADTSDHKAYRPYLAFNIASSHMGTDVDYNELNTGVGFGLAFPVARGGEVSAEIGTYKNSFSTYSTYTSLTYDIPVADLGARTELRLGGFVGLVDYPQNTQKFRDGGAVMIGDSVLLAGITATVRHNDRYDLRARIVPGGSAATAIATLQLGVRF